MKSNSLTGRLKRYGETSTTVATLLMQLGADRYLGHFLNEEKHALSLAGTLGNLKGPLMKIAQILATVPDILPEEYAEAFLTLQSNAPPMGWPFVKRRMQGELGKEWESHFRFFSPMASAAASLGQVHKAIDHEGTVLACKLQYPAMGAAVEADLHHLKLALKSFELYSGALETQNAYQEIKDRLWEELDYIKEAERMNQFRRFLAPFPEIVVPKVIQKLSTSHLLTMTWAEGEKLLTFKNAPQTLRNHICKTLFQAWYGPFYGQGFLHGDPHPGNYSWSQEGQLNLFDFGCVREFSTDFLQSVVALYRALQDKNPKKIAQAYEMWGFRHLTYDLVDTLTLWAHFLFEPFLENRVRPLHETYSGQDGRRIAGEVLTKLKALGGVCPPREFVFMDRAAVGLGSIFIHLKAELNWHQLLESIIKN